MERCFGSGRPSQPTFHSSLHCYIDHHGNQLARYDAALRRVLPDADTGTNAKRTMGEAKRNLERVRQSFLAEIDKWAFPATDWEAQTVEELKSMPIRKAIRYPSDALEYMRMMPRQCHVNARFMQDNDPEGRLRQVTGWWLQDANYVLHSVVDQYGQLVCVTPAPPNPENSFDFIPDPKIEWRDEGDHREAYREGSRIGPGLRSDPEKTLALLEVIRMRLLSGMNPYRALQADGERLPGQLGSQHLNGG